ncbi:hypothetical protein ACWEV4_31415 [Streptomyces sp. NPDC003860]
MADQGEAQTGSERARLGAVEPPPGAPAGTVRTVTGSRARKVNDQEAPDQAVPPVGENTAKAEPSA